MVCVCVGMWVGINNSSPVVNHSAAVHHKQENVRPFNQDHKTADGQTQSNLSVCSETAELINEMNEESKDGQGKG